MHKLHIIVGVVGLASSALQAQTPQRMPAPERDRDCVTTDGKFECRIVRMSGSRDSLLRKRAALGLQLQPTHTKRDTLGVFIGRVTPGGPAELAGVVEGERIASINGVDLKVAAADIEDHYTAGLPAHRLTREVAKLAPGSRVNLRVYSGGRYRDVQVTAGSQFDMMKKGGEGFGYMFGPEGGMMHMGPGASGMMFRSAPRVRVRTGPSEMLRSLPRGGDLELEFNDIETEKKEIKPSKDSPKSKTGAQSTLRTTSSI